MNLVVSGDVFSHIGEREIIGVNVHLESLVLILQELMDQQGMDKDLIFKSPDEVKISLQRDKNLDKILDEQ